MIRVAPFICKWSDAHAHSEPQYFKTQWKLERHVFKDHKDLTSLKAFDQGHQIYICPWEDCDERQSDITELKDHLRQHTQQKPFKCPVCNDSRRFEVPNRLSRHLISNHNDNYVDFTGADDMTKGLSYNTDESDDSESENDVEEAEKNKDESDSEEYTEVDVESDDYQICKALLPRYFDREYIEKLKRFYRIKADF